MSPFAEGLRHVREIHRMEQRRSADRLRQALVAHAHESQRANNFETEIRYLKEHLRSVGYPQLAANPFMVVGP